jgi:hypothetical protein
MAAEYCGVKCGLKFNPPTLVVFYKQTGKSKLRKRSMPLRHLKTRRELSAYAEELCGHERHGKYVQLIPLEQLILLLERAKNGKDYEVPKAAAPHFSLVTPTTKETPISPVKAPSKLPALPKSDDLLGLSNLPSLEKSSVVSQGNFPPKVKSLTAETKGVTSPQNTISKPKFPMDDDKSLEELLEDLSEASGDQENFDKGGEHNAAGTGSHSKGTKIEEDLNKVAENVLVQQKEAMDVLFEANRIKPGDEGWVYNKEVDFDEEDKMSCGWDSSDKSDPEF